MIIEFSNEGEFAAMRAAETWCATQHISVGSQQADWPRGLVVGDVSIGKWRNLSPADRDLLHGVMLGKMRSGPVRIVLLEHQPAVRALLERIRGDDGTPGSKPLGSLPVQPVHRQYAGLRSHESSLVPVNKAVLWPVRRRASTSVQIPATLHGIDKKD